MHEGAVAQEIVESRSAQAGTVESGGGHDAEDQGADHASRGYGTNVEPIYEVYETVIFVDGLADFTEHPFEMRINCTW